MLYQFLDWRRRGFRTMMLGTVEQGFARLRNTNAGVLPQHLDRWDHYIAFAGNWNIPLPQNDVVARTITKGHESFPSLVWLDEQYTLLLAHVAATDPLLLENPSWSPPVPPPVDIVSHSVEDLIRGSVSNTEGSECSVPSPQTSSHSLTSAALPNSSATAKKPPSPQRRP